MASVCSLHLWQRQHALSLVCTGPDAVSELFAAAGPRLGLIGTMSKLPGFNIIFGLMYDTISHNRHALQIACRCRLRVLAESICLLCRFAISKAATRVSEAVGRK